MQCEIATWYDNWNSIGLANLVAKKVPLTYATRYNLAFASLLTSPDGYTLGLDQQFGSQVLAQIRQQAPAARICAGIGDAGIAETVADNLQHTNRSTANIVAYLKEQALDGMTIDAEGAGMSSVTALLSQLSPISEFQMQCKLPFASDLVL